MTRTVFTLMLFLSAIATLNAQDFIDHLTSKGNGQGTVTVQQDQRLNDIVNGKKQASQQKDREEKVTSVTPGKKVKARGYRIQVYWGGSTSADKANAYRMANRATTFFPELQAYTSFKSPNWVCRVGDFATREDAAIYLQKVKETKIAEQAVIVKSEVYVTAQ